MQNNDDHDSHDEAPKRRLYATQPGPRPRGGVFAAERRGAIKRYGTCPPAPLDRETCCAPVLRAIGGLVERCDKPLHPGSAFCAVHAREGFVIHEECVGRVVPPVVSLAPDERPQRRVAPGGCIVTDPDTGVPCGRQVRRGGLCRAHLAQAERGETPMPILPGRRGRPARSADSYVTAAGNRVYLCKVPGCSRTVQHRGLCYTHARYAESSEL